MRKLIFFVTAMLMIATVQSQNVTLGGIKSMHLRNIMPIVENQEVKGYLAFYMVEKANSKQNIYKLNIYDNNLTIKFDLDLTLPKTTFFLEGSYNGTVFCFSFLDTKSKTFTMMNYDLEGKQIAKKVILGLTKVDVGTYYMATQVEGAMSFGIMSAVPELGFIRYGMTDKRKAATITFYDNEANKVWGNTVSGTDKNDYVTAIPMGNSKDFVSTMVYVRESMTSQKIKNTELVFNNISDGGEAFVIDCKEGKFQLGINGVSMENEDFFIFGEYYNKTDNPFKDESVGLFFIKLDKTGKRVNESYVPWTGGVSKKVPSALKTDKGKRARLAIHKIIKTSDNKYFAVCEQYRMTADAMGIASNVLGGGYGASNTKMNLLDMVVLEFDDNMEISGGEVIEKSKSIVYLPAGLEMYGPSFVAYYLKYSRQFDYCFTTMSADRSTFSSVYVNYDRESEGKNNIVGNIYYSKDKKIVFDKIPVKEGATYYLALPGKAGYVGVMEYFKKKKTAEIRLEKLN